MSEFSENRDVIVDGRVKRGRSYRREDGTYESLDLKEVANGEIVTVITDNGAHELIKNQDAPEHDSAMDNWHLGPEAVRLFLTVPAGNGASFLHHGIVLREGLGLEISYPASKQPNILHSLGTIATIASRRMAGPGESEQPGVLSTIE